MVEYIRLQTLAVWALFIVHVVAGISYVDTIGYIAGAVALFIGAISHHFSLSYMRQQKIKLRYFFHLGALTIALYVFMTTTNIVLLFAALFIAKLQATSLVSVQEFDEAKVSARKIKKLFFLSDALLFVACTYFVLTYNTVSLHEIARLIQKKDVFFVSLVVFSSFIQSAQVGFYRWIVHSLNAPTPVSALLHGGLVNGAALLLLRFYPAFSKLPFLSTVIFITGLTTALVFAFSKLIQTDIKRMLGLSTVSQMGFMMMQFGLGLYAQAFLHMLLHGLFKAYLFLNSGGQIFSEKTVSRVPLKSWQSMVAGIIALQVSSLFAFYLHQSLTTPIAIIAALFCFFTVLEPFLQKIRKKEMVVCFFGINTMVLLYAAAVGYFDLLYFEQNTIEVGLFELLLTLSFGSIWIISQGWLQRSQVYKKIWVYFLNWTSPDPETILVSKIGVSR